MSISKFIGLDVHKMSNSIAVADAKGGEVRYLGTIDTDDASIRKLVKRLGKPSTLSFVYEAGPTGYELYRLLKKLGCKVQVIAPSLIPTRAGNKVKTDRLDAMRLAQLHRAGELTAITVPGKDQEALRDLTRCRDDAVNARKQAKQQITGMLLQKNRKWKGKSNWTVKHYDWLRTQRFESAATQLAFEEYLRRIDHGTATIKRLEDAMARLGEESEFSSMIHALTALRGIKMITATVIAAELGDVTRFKSPKQLAAFVGVIPKEHSSGNRVQRGGITKTGNRFVRRILTEAAWNQTRRPTNTRCYKEMMAKFPDSIGEISWDASVRLFNKFDGLTKRGKATSLAVTAVVREMLGFIWSIAREVKRLEADLKTPAVIG